MAEGRCSGLPRIQKRNETKRTKRQPLLQRTGQPKLAKEVTAELGNVTPYVIVPGPWTDADIAYHAANVAAGLANNNGHNCLAAEVRWRACVCACAGRRAALCDLVLLFRRLGLVEGWVV